MPTKLVFQYVSKPKLLNNEPDFVTNYDRLKIEEENRRYFPDEAMKPEEY
jgi:hypothetical protein